MPQIAPNLTAPTAMPFVRRHLKHAGVGLFCLAVLFGSVFLYSRHNDFSSFFHPDEPSKAVQILRNTRTYLHPQLMLEATELALKLSGKAPELTVTGRREVTVTGRWVSALFA